MRVIDADKLIELIDDDIVSLDKNMSQEGHDVCLCTLEMVKQYIKALPTVDAEPIKHGRWIATEKGAKVTAYECSKCGRVVWDDTGYDVSKDYPYCHCGAKMDEAEG